MKKLLILVAACALTFSCGESNDDFGDNGNPGTETPGPQPEPEPEPEPAPEPEPDFSLTTVWTRLPENIVRR